MHLTEVRTKARQMRIRTLGRSKTEMIRIMQIKEGNIPCYQNQGDSCPQKHCCWRRDCLGPDNPLTNSM